MATWRVPSVRWSESAQRCSPRRASTPHRKLALLVEVQPGPVDCTGGVARRRQVAKQLLQALWTARSTKRLPILGRTWSRTGEDAEAFGRLAACPPVFRPSHTSRGFPSTRKFRRVTKVGTPPGTSAGRPPESPRAHHARGLVVGRGVCRPLQRHRPGHRAAPRFCVVAGRHIGVTFHTVVLDVPPTPLGLVAGELRHPPPLHAVLGGWPPRSWPTMHPRMTGHPRGKEPPSTNSSCRTREFRDGRVREVASRWTLRRSAGRRHTTRTAPVPAARRRPLMTNRKMRELVRGGNRRIGWRQRGSTATAMTAVVIQ